MVCRERQRFIRVAADCNEEAIPTNAQRAAVARLQAEDSERDLSDVLQESLENWLKT
jgi:hypothetical protein